MHNAYASARDHLSGHSHRAGVYVAQPDWTRHGRGPITAMHVAVRQALDPGLHGQINAKAGEHAGRTRFVVSSSGGPVGIQNLAGELEGWTLRPPSGTWLDAATGAIRQVKSRAPNTRPRLCVALDYLHVMKPQTPPLRFLDPAEERRVLFGAARSANPRGKASLPEHFAMVESATLTQLDCIAEVGLWVFEAGRDAERISVRRWMYVKAAIGEPDADLVPAAGSAKRYSREAGERVRPITFSEADKALLLRLMQTGKRTQDEGGKEVFIANQVAQAFCEVKLRKPVIGKGQPDWSADMNCEDSWFFPLDIMLIAELRRNQPTVGGGGLGPGKPEVDTWRVELNRPMGERGEVPDWNWLAEAFAGKGYIRKKFAIQAGTSNQQ